MRRDDQERGRRRRAHELEQQRRAVDVPPVRVVDEQDERAAPGKAGEELAQRDERPHANEVRVDDRVASAVADARNAPQNREEPGEEPDVVGELQGLSGLFQLHEKATQRVDHAVECLVRHGLALVGAAPQDHRFAALRQPVEEVTRDGRLAHARLAAEANGDAAAGQHLVERRAQRASSALAADEHRVAVRVDDRRRRRERTIAPGRAEPPQISVPGGRFSGSSARSAAHSESRSAGIPETSSEGRRASRVVFCESTSTAEPSKGGRPVSASKSSTPTLYQSQAGVSASSESLLRRHVRHRSDHPAFFDGARVAREFGGHAEVQQDDAPIGGDEDVRRLDVAVQLAGRVHRRRPSASCRSAGRSL